MPNTIKQHQPLDMPDHFSQFRFFTDHIFEIHINPVALSPLKLMIYKWFANQVTYIFPFSDRHKMVGSRPLAGTYTTVPRFYPWSMSRV